MILASVINEAGEGSMSTVLSKSTVHRYRQRRRREAAEQINQDYQATKSVVHWDGKLLLISLVLRIVKLSESYILVQN